LNLRRSCQDLSKGRDFDHFIDWSADMPKEAVRILPSLPATSTKSDSSEFVSIALFSGLGLLVSLLAVLMGVPGVWY
jgi:hypothetical protein